MRNPWLNQFPIHFPDSLPITAHLIEIQTALEQHQVIVVAGETGSGKTTQLPKLALAMGRGCFGRIGHTQPRRIAAHSVAVRLAEELKVPLGEQIGYQVRFHQQLSDSSYIKLMTDGILLAELAFDRELKKYDTLIIDEAHERSLNIDFILGYLKWLLRQRNDLKVIITSATLDHQRFSTHFNHCPVIEVSGRSYPVEIIYQPLSLNQALTQDVAQHQAILQAIHTVQADGDILIFLSGERDIRQCGEFLRQAALRNTEILPLYSKLTHLEQQKIFSSGAQRRIILATNIAETSLTIPNIRYVIDTGMARIKRYNSRSKIQRLPIEAIAQASAKQRAGRCGRTAAGVCIRLYSEEDFLSREKFTQPEILRSNLAHVILHMLILQLGEVEQFPWLDPPENQYWRDAYQCLEELQAIDRDQHNKIQLTRLGVLLTKISLDPRLGRMLIAAAQKNCLAELLVITSGLSVADIMLRPSDQRQAAFEKQRLFTDQRSDFLTLLNVWWALTAKQTELSKRQFQKFCDRHFISYIKFKEWQDLYHELKNSTLRLFKLNNKLQEPTVETADFLMTPVLYPTDSPGWVAIHQSILTGLLGQIAQKQDHSSYLAARLRTVQLFPGTPLIKKPPAWLMALELFETKQVYAKTVAPIDPLWVELLAPQSIKKTYSEPYWDSKRGEVMAFEKVLFFGLTLVAKRRIRYAAVDAETAHQVFLRAALAQRQLVSQLDFWRHNEQFLIELEQLEDKLRARHLVPDEQWLYEFYRFKIPNTITSAIELEKWWRLADRELKNNLWLKEQHLALKEDASHSQAYPTEFLWQSNVLKISYQFAPGSETDGVSLTVPLPLLQQLPATPFVWLVPGLLEEKIQALLKGLDKESRKALMPLAATAKICMQHLTINTSEDFFVCFSQLLQQQFSCPLSADSLSALSLPDFLKFNFIVVDEGQVLAMGRDLLRLQQQLLTSSGEQNRMVTSLIYPTWPTVALLPEITIQQHGVSLIKYQALQAEKEGVSLVAVDSLLIAQQIHQWGVTKLLQLHCSDQLSYVIKKLLYPTLRGNKTLKNVHLLTTLEKYFLTWPSFTDYFCYALIQMTFAENFWQLRTADDFFSCLKTHQSDLIENAQSLLTVVQSILLQLSRLQQIHSDFDLSDLIFTGFLVNTPWEWLQRYPLYLRATIELLERYPSTWSEKIKPYHLAKQLYNQQANSFLQTQHLPKPLSLQVAHHPEVFFNPWSCLNEPLSRIYYLLQEFHMTLCAPQYKSIESVSWVRLQKLLS